jgi:hypothetical protein
MFAPACIRAEDTAVVPGCTHASDCLYGGRSARFHSSQRRMARSSVLACAQRSRWLVSTRIHSSHTQITRSNLFSSTQISRWVILLAPMPVVSLMVGWVSTQCHSSHRRIARSSLLVCAQMSGWLFLLAPMPVIVSIVGCVSAQLHSSHMRMHVRTRLHLSRGHGRCSWMHLCQ